MTFIRFINKYLLPLSLLIICTMVLDIKTAFSKDKVSNDSFSCYGVPDSSLTSLKSIIKDILHVPIVFVGEKHDQYADHIVQLKIIKALYEHDHYIAVGMEMFEKRYQPVINEYLAGKIDEKTFIKKTHYLKNWSFNYLMYRPIIEFCKKHHLPIVALNAPNEIANKVALKGLKSLSKKERKEIPKKLIFPNDNYKKLLKKIFKIHTGLSNFKYFCEAQTVWDQTMADSIVAFLQKHPEYQMVVLTGSGHVIFGYGIPHRVKIALPLRQAIIINVHDDQLKPNMADFFLFPPFVKQPYSPHLGVFLTTTKINGKKYLKVVDVIPHSAAWKAGIKPGYLILAFDGKPIHNIYDLKLDLLFKHEGDTATVKVEKIRKILPNEVFTLKVGPFKEEPMFNMFQMMGMKK